MSTAFPPGDHLAGADKMIARPLPAGAPLLELGAVWELFDEAELRRWLGVHKRAIAAGEAVIREASEKNLRHRRAVAQIDRELTRRFQAGAGKEA